MWRELINRLSDKHRFNPPVAASTVASAEETLGILLPTELKASLRETNGVEDAHGAGLIWSAERIAHDNLEFRQSLAFRELYKPFDSLLFFADSGNGDQFAFAILDGVVRHPDVFVWEHENDSRTWVAASLESYLALRLTGNLIIQRRAG